MESNQFSCPHCSGEFAVEHLTAGQAVACPHCGAAVVLPDTSSETSPSTETAESESDAMPMPGQPVVEEDGVFDFLESPSVAASSAGPSKLATEAINVRRLSREEKEFRRTVRNLVLMVVGVVVLAVTAVVLSRV